MIWLGYADCGLPPDLDESACNRVSSALPQGALVVAAWSRDPHCDHQTGAQIVGRVARRRTDLKVLWYPIWGRFREDRHLPSMTVLEASPAAHQAKRRALACHATQMTRLIADDPEGFVMEPAMQAHFLEHPEIFLAD